MTPEQFQAEVDKQHQAKQAMAQRSSELQAIGEIVHGANAVNIKHRSKHEPRVTVKNFPALAKTKDIQQIGKKVDQLQKVISKNSTLGQVVGALGGLSKAVEQYAEGQMKSVEKLGMGLVQEMPTLPEFPKQLSVDNLKDVKPYFENLSKDLKSSINKLKLDPQINVPAPDVKVEQQSVDIGPLVKSLESVQKTLKSIADKKEPEVDLKPLKLAVNKTTKAIQSLRFPVSNYVLPFRNEQGKADQVQLTSTGAMPVDIQDTSVTTVPSTTANSAVTQVNSSASSVQLLASNTARKMATFFNDSTQALYLKLGTTASSSSYTVKMAAASYYELPPPIFTGRIDGIWASANGSVLITEET